MDIFLERKLSPDVHVPSLCQFYTFLIQSVTLSASISNMYFRYFSTYGVIFPTFLVIKLGVGVANDILF